MDKHQFFEVMAQQGNALTYDDVRLKTGYSEVTPATVTLNSLFSRNVPLRVPIVSAPMDALTESRMAIALAKLGGLGIIHRNLTPTKQVKQITKVKLHLNALIEKPICVFGDETIEAIENRRQEHGDSFQSFPVTDRSGRLIGLLTRNDFELCDSPQSTAEQAMTRDPITANEATGINEAYHTMRTHKKKVLPLIDEQKMVTGMYVFSDVKRIKSGSPDGYNIDAHGHLRVGAAITSFEEDFERAAMLVKAGVDVLVLDTAHGDTKFVINMLEKLKGMFPETDIVAGNVSEGSSAKRLAEAGADGIRVGQGPGAICTTRIVAGVGCPQVTAVYNCGKAVEGMNIPVCADGGISSSGDIPIAIGIGAHNVMLGLLLVGADESAAPVVTVEGVEYKVYRGMGSLGAMQESLASRRRYGQKTTDKDQFVPEGVEGLVPCQGPLQKVLHQLVEGLRRGMAYVGAATIGELRQKAGFYRLSPAGQKESHPHHLSYMKDAPNYRRREVRL